MSVGYQTHEAEEVALPLFILLEPEPGAGQEDWEREELAEPEREYERKMRDEEDWETQKGLADGPNIEGVKGELTPEDTVEIANPAPAVEPVPLIEKHEAMDAEVRPTQGVGNTDADIDAALEAAMREIEAEEAPTPAVSLRDQIVCAYSKAVGGKFNQNVDLADLRRAFPRGPGGIGGRTQADALRKGDNAFRYQQPGRVNAGNAGRMPRFERPVHARTSDRLQY